MRDRNLFLVLALLFALPAARLAAQNVPAAGPAKLPSSSDLRLEFVHVEDASDIFSTVEQLYGRHFAVEDEGSTRSIYNLMLLGDSILIHDRPGRVEAVKAGIETIVGELAQVTVADRGLVSSEVEVEYIGLSEAIAALGSLARIDGMGPMGTTYANVRPIESRSMLMLNDSKERVAEMKRIIGLIDTPRPQVLIRCRIVQGSAELENPDPRIAKLLPPEMKELTRFEHFEMLATGAIRVSTGSGQPIQMQMSGRDGLAAELELRTGGYSTQTRTLQLERVQFGFSGPQPDEKGRRRETQQLMTSTTLPADEIVVIGALGENPIFVILEMDVIDG